MKKRVLSLFLAFAMILGLMPAVTAAETVKIGTAEALFDFADRVNGTGDYSVPEPDLSAVLTGDITVAEEWVPIGLKAAPYAGIFDGGGYSITLSNGITYRGTNERYGPFGTVSGTIQNLTVKGSIDFSNQAGNVGGIAGYLNGGKVQACLNEASIAGKNNVGGIVGMNSKGQILLCGNSGEIQASASSLATNAGGIVGSNSGGTLQGCYNVGKIKAATNYAGGLVGANAALLASCYIENCYSAGAVDESTIAGAVAGTESGTKGLTYNNIFYSTDSASKAIGKSGTSAPAGTPEAKEEAALKAAVLALQDGAGESIFAEDTENINNGWPVLAWQASGGSSGDQVLEGDLTISGKAYVGGTLTARYSGSDTEVSYQWYRGSTVIDGAVSASYTVTDEDIESELKVTAYAEGYASKTESAGAVPNYIAFDVTPDTASMHFPLGITPIQRQPAVNISMLPKASPSPVTKTAA